MNLLSWYGIVVVLLFLWLSFCLRKINKSIVFSPIIIPLLTLAISFGTFLSIDNSGVISEREFTLIFWYFLLFIFAYSLLIFIPKKYLISHLNSKIKHVDIGVLYFLFYISMGVTFIYSYLLWGAYSSGDERLLLNQNYRALSLVKSLLDIWVISLAAIVFAITKSKKILILIIVTIIISFISGSKSSALALFLWVIFFYLQFNTISSATKVKVSALLIVLLFMPTFVMYGNDFLEKIIYRISMSGDVYIISFLSGDYKALIGLYNPVEYLFHPFTSLFGLRGYEYPFGAELIGTMGYDVTGMGPNAQLPMLAITFWPSCNGCVVLFSIVMAILFIVTILIAFFIYNSKQFPLYFRICIFTLLFSGAFNLFIDIGMYQFTLILCVMAFCLYFILSVIRQSYFLGKKG